MTIILSSSILSADFTRLADQIRIAEDSGVDWIHIDVMDGVFVPNITMGQFMVETCRRVTQLPLDVHLMIVQPERHIESFVNAGATNLTVHIEGNPHIYKTLQDIHRLGCKASIVMNPGTPTSSIASVVELVDMVLLMSVNPGASGQSFITSTVAKVEQVNRMLQDARSNALIEVDGGVTSENLPVLYQAGARVFVAATSIFKHQDGIAAGVHALRSSVAD